MHRAARLLPAATLVVAIVTAVAAPAAVARGWIVHLRARNTRPFEPPHAVRIASRDSAADAAAAARLLASGAAEWIEPDAPREPMDAPSTPTRAPAARHARVAFPDDPLYRDGRQWGLANDGTYVGAAGADVRAAAAWARSRGAPWLRLAVLDSGIDPAHPDLAWTPTGEPRLVDARNVTSDPSGSWADSTAHGTAVAGVMAALTNDGAHFDSLGLAGVCGGDGGANPGCRIVPIKVTLGHAGGASAFDIARGIVAAVAAGARAVNLSFGGTLPSRTEREALRFAAERGCLVVCAAGNRGATAPNAPVYPAAYATDGLALAVGACDAWDRRAAFSSYGPGLDLVAPGVDVWTTYPTYPPAGGATYPGYVAVAGTSFAAPFATGAAGLLVAMRPELAADDVRELLRRTARDVGPPGPDAETGAGVLDAGAATAALDGGTGVWHDEVAADTWREDAVDSLWAGETGPGTLVAGGWPGARRIEASVTLALPDSFADGAFAWPRVAGTSTVRGDFRLPYATPHAEVVWRDARTFTLRGWLYRVATGGDTVDVPLPFDQMRFGFTVFGRVRRALGRAAPPPAAARVLDARPNPFARALVLERPPGATLDVLDVTGRHVRRFEADGSVAPVRWDGCDDRGRAVPPGLYWVAARDGAARPLRVVKLE